MIHDHKLSEFVAAVAASTKSLLSIRAAYGSTLPYHVLVNLYI